MCIGNGKGKSYGVGTMKWRFILCHNHQVFLYIFYYSQKYWLKKETYYFSKKLVKINFIKNS